MWQTASTEVMVHAAETQAASQLTSVAWLQELQQLPPNDVSKHITDAMAEAVRAFGVPDAVMVMIVLPNDGNSYDQQARTCFETDCHW